MTYKMGHRSNTQPASNGHTQNMCFNFPDELVGKHCRLEKLTHAHTEDLARAVCDGELWKVWYASVPEPTEIAYYVEQALSDTHCKAYAVIDGTTNSAIGTTRFYNIEPLHRRAMLGYTWYAKSNQGSLINPECKFLLFSNFFEAQNGLAVEFRTHYFNQRSRQAIERLGAKQDGILRSHQIMRDGSIRDTVVYSVLSTEWPAVRNGLLQRLSNTPY